jgi:ABC-type transport system involved in cytochrome c biogenesis permease subunit
MSRIILAFIICFIGVLPISAKANDIDYTAFANWPVLHEGRIKTMESFSRSILYQMKGDIELDKMQSIEWVAQAIFEPFETITKPVIRVSRLNYLNLPDRKTNLYSLNELMIALRELEDQIVILQRVDPSTLSASQKDLLTVYFAMVTQTQLIQSMGPILPLVGYDGSYSDGVGSIEQRALIEAAGQDNHLLKIIPDLNNPNVQLMTVWDAYIDGGIDSHPALTHIKDMALAWNDGNYNQWSMHAAKVEKILNASLEKPFLISLESVYTKTNPILLAMLVYIVGSLIVLKYHFVGMTVLGVGFIIQLIGLLTRSIILQRPPTGTIYETLLFAAIIIMIASLIYLKKKGSQSIIAGWGLAAAFLLFVAQGFTGGDSLNVLIAVLNTNFWLSTHVTCIIIGYALCIMAAMTGHLYLLKPSDALRHLLMPITLFALLFTAVGTLLGGIWADQSWGRFWGWDPKENGALLIVLWLIWIIHGRISHHFTLTGFAAALGLTNIMVALTWFGVNLLGVGLHSYGFISGVAYGLIAFCTAQTIIIFGLYWRRRMLDA